MITAQNFSKQVISLRRSAAFRQLCREAKYALWLPVFLILFLILEQRSVTEFWYTELPVDAFVPFCEHFVVFYCAWYPLLIGLGLYLLFRDSAVYRRYMKYLAITFLVSAVVWFLLPTAQSLRPVVFPRDNIFSDIMAGLYSIDTNTNVLPSVHVVGSVGAALAAWDCPHLRQRKWICPTITVLSILICASTLFTKQHAVLDLLTGLILALAVSLPLYGRQWLKKAS